MCSTESMTTIPLPPIIKRPYQSGDVIVYSGTVYTIQVHSDKITLSDGKVVNSDSISLL